METADTARRGSPGAFGALPHELLVRLLAFLAADPVALFAARAASPALRIAASDPSLWRELSVTHELGRRARHEIKAVHTVLAEEVIDLLQCCADLAAAQGVAGIRSALFDFRRDAFAPRESSAILATLAGRHGAWLERLHVPDTSELPFAALEAFLAHPPPRLAELDLFLSPPSGDVVSDSQWRSLGALIFAHPLRKLALRGPEGIASVLRRSSACPTLEALHLAESACETLPPYLAASFPRLAELSLEAPYLYAVGGASSWASRGIAPNLPATVRLLRADMSDTDAPDHEASGFLRAFSSRGQFDGVEELELAVQALEMTVGEAEEVLRGLWAARESRRGREQGWRALRKVTITAEGRAIVSEGPGMTVECFPNE
ncbi:hypothetical protein DFJ74DRAFT_713367 [Hyaloraphidium curvatum]|nr:hypothetical protein DFJ74DRAFT_713367 [Hyaloraphidium curvatum]